MATDYKTPEQIAEEYLTELKVLKPSVNRDQKDSDWWIRSRVVGGVVSGVYADQRLIANDAFPQRARHDALGRALETYLNDTFRPATSSQGFAASFGDPGSVILSGTQYLYEPNGNIYQATEDTNFGSATGVLVPVQSVATGQSQNIISGAALKITSPPTGVQEAAVASGDLGSGRNLESDSEAAARILAFIRDPISGGKASDYELWAVAADSAVVKASTIRFYRGLGSVGVVIISGTTDVDAALDAGDPIVVTPSDALIAAVQSYLEERQILTDCVTVIGPTLVPLNVTINVRYAQGDGTTILAGQTLTQEQLVQREVKRAIYKTPPGGRKFGGVGYVLESEIEETVDVGLSAMENNNGKLAMLTDRQVVLLGGVNSNYQLSSDQYPIPNTITVVDLNA